MAGKFGLSSDTSAHGSDDVVVKEGNLYESDQKLSSDAISLMSIETDRSNTSAAAQRSHRNTGKWIFFAFLLLSTEEVEFHKKVMFIFSLSVCISYVIHNTQMHH